METDRTIKISVNLMYQKTFPDKKISINYTLTHTVPI